MHGWALVELGEVIQGIAEMTTAIAGFHGLGGVPHMQYLIAVRAEAIARIGRIHEALPELDRTLAHIELTGDTRDHAEMLRLKGAVLLMHNSAATAEAEKCFREAVHVARAQEARWWELRATVSLARLLHDTNRSDEAHTMLADIYGWFSEGFELPDLRDAKALLDELSC
jgi:predicted ATPase